MAELKFKISLFDKPIGYGINVQELDTNYSYMLMEPQASFTAALHRWLGIINNLYATGQYEMIEELTSSGFKGSHRSVIFKTKGPCIWAFPPLLES